MTEEQIEQLKKEYLLINEKIDSQYEIIKILKKERESLFEKLTGILQGK